MGEVAEKIRSDLDYDFRVAQSQMWIAENDLVDALNEKQYDLYKDYSLKRERFFKSQSSCTKERFDLKVGKRIVDESINRLQSKSGSGDRAAFA